MPGLVAIHDPFARGDLLTRFAPMCQHPPSPRPFHRDTHHSLDGTLCMGRIDLTLFNPTPPPIHTHNGRYSLMMQGELADGLPGVARLNGSYFFIFWDDDARRLVMGSDRPEPHACVR